MRVDEAILYYDPFIRRKRGESKGMIVRLKPFKDDPRCLFGWGPPSCNCKFGHGCVRELGHRGRCWDGIENDPLRCSYRKRPEDWDSHGRDEANR